MDYGDYNLTRIFSEDYKTGVRYRATLGANLREVREVEHDLVPVAKDGVAYVYKWHSTERKYSEEIYQRAANGTSHLEGFARDEFIRGKCREEFKKQLTALQNNAGGLTKAELVSALKEIQDATVVGAQVWVDGAVSLVDPNFAALGSPKGFVFDGQHVCDVKGWREAYLALLDKLNELDAAKFDALPTDGYFRKFFVDPLPRARLSGYSTAPHKYGTSGKIRAKELGGKAYFANPDYTVQRLLALFGVDKARVALRG